VILFTLADGSYLLLPDDATYELVSKKLTIQGGSPMQEAHRLEELSNKIIESTAKLRKK
jgi:hypothetical protein